VQPGELQRKLRDSFGSSRQPLVRTLQLQKFPQVPVFCQRLCKVNLSMDEHCSFNPISEAPSFPFESGVYDVFSDWDIDTYQASELEDISNCLPDIDLHPAGILPINSEDLPVGSALTSYVSHDKD
jgi:hypothetical protein